MDVHKGKKVLWFIVAGDLIILGDGHQPATPRWSPRIYTCVVKDLKFRLSIMGCLDLC